MDFVKHYYESKIQYGREFVEAIEEELAKENISREFREQLLMVKYNVLNEIGISRAKLDELN